jgi:hypothetical protein
MATDGPRRFKNKTSRTRKTAGGHGFTVTSRGLPKGEPLVDLVPCHTVSVGPQKEPNLAGRWALNACRTRVEHHVAGRSFIIEEKEKVWSDLYESDASKVGQAVAPVAAYILMSLTGDIKKYNIIIIFAHRKKRLELKAEYNNNSTNIFIVQLMGRELLQRSGFYRLVFGLDLVNKVYIVLIFFFNEKFKIKSKSLKKITPLLELFLNQFFSC